MILVLNYIDFELFLCVYIHVGLNLSLTRLAFILSIGDDLVLIRLFNILNVFYAFIN